MTFFISCNSDKKIISLLKSQDSNEIILGAYEAGESGNKEFVPLLLEGLDNEGMSTESRFKGITIYQAKMIALKKIYKKEPPVKISYKLDSVVVNYFKNLSDLP
jgi:hypothetical protein